MAGAHAAEPIKLGVLMDYAMPDSDVRDDFVQPLELVFKDGLESGMIDRPVELVYREVDGLPRGTVKAVIDAFGELVDEGCLGVVGPNISDNAVAVREEIERRFRVPAISVCGSEDWLGEWTFLLNNGSMTDEPILWAHLMAKAGQKTAGMLVERSYIGQTYLLNFRRAAQHAGIQIVGEEYIAQTGRDIGAAVRTLHDSGAEAIVHCGFGLGVAEINDALRSLDWDPPRYMGTALETGFDARIWDAFVGWIGLEQYDEGNSVATEFLDRFEAAYGRRPEYFNPVLWRDVATSFLHALADATPLSPRGVRDALERVKMLPAACGSAGTRISFGRWSHRGWMGAGYLVARTLDPKGKAEGKLWKSTLVGRYGQD
jgi:ABC-type branched-subunit amino acid transport system substrate-binding protein